MRSEENKRKRRKVRLIVLAVLVSPVLIFSKQIYYAVNALADAQRAGMLDATKQHKYQGSVEDNLKALYTAIKLYEESEGALPNAEGWMDAAKNYVRTNDLKKGEEMKKFVNPRISGKEGEFGFAFNSKLSGAYSDEVKDPKNTPLIFESTDRAWNASGSPAQKQPSPPLDGGNWVVTVDGTVTTLDKLEPDKN